MNETKIKRIGCLIGGGLLAIVIGLFITGGSVTGGMMALDATGGRSAGPLLLAGVGVLLIIAGIGMIIWGIIGGFMASKSGISKKEFRYPNCFVIIRFAINDAGEQVYDVLEGEDPDYKYYVQLQLPNGRKEEFRCYYPVFMCCGEGLRGDAVAQGNWLSQFVAYVPGSVAS